MNTAWGATGEYILLKGIVEFNYLTGLSVV